MTTSKRYESVLAHRRTVPLTGTIHKVNAQLDAEALLSIEYAQAWLFRVRHQKVTASAVIRRALEKYMRHLACAGEEEFFAVTSRSQALTMSFGSEELTEARLRLHASDPEQPMPSFREVRYSRREIAEMDALHAKLDALNSGAAS